MKQEGLPKPFPFMGLKTVGMSKICTGFLRPMMTYGRRRGENGARDGHSPQINRPSSEKAVDGNPRRPESEKGVPEKELRLLLYAIQN